MWFRVAIGAAAIVLPAFAQSIPDLPMPSEQQQRDVIGAARNYAVSYTKSLPNFVCSQVTERFFDPTGKENFIQADTIEATLTYNGERESYETVLHNNRTQGERRPGFSGGTTSSGEFASLLQSIFEPSAEASFQWERWGSLRGRVTHVYSYRVEQPHSRWMIMDVDSKKRLNPAFRGLIYIDRERGQILRVSLDSLQVPVDFPIQEARVRLDYDWAEVNGKRYLLPFQSEVRLDRGKFSSRNDVYFRSYRKFSTDAAVTFGDSLHK